MPFDFASQWPLIATPTGTLVFLWVAIARRWLMFGSEYRERVKDLKESHAAAIAEKDKNHTTAMTTLRENHTTAIADKDAEIKHLRDVSTKAMDAIERIADVQEDTLRTTDIVKTVMQNLQASAKAKDPTGPMEKVRT